MLRIEHLTKTFGDKKAVDDLSVHIGRGEIYGFIGHNGAGKTTTLKSVVGILKPDEGEIILDGMSLKDNPIECKKRIAYIPDNPDLYTSQPTAQGKMDVKMMATVFAEWTKNEEFRKLYLEQPYICLKHYVLITEAAMGKGGVPSKLLPAFHDDTLKLTRGYLESLKEDVSYFVTMFDYRSKGQEWGTSVDAIERSIEFLTQEKP